MDWETWGLPLMILSVGLSAGMFLATSTRVSDTVSKPEEDLSARRDALLEQIRELDADREKMDPAHYLARREQLISEAASALRNLETDTAPPPRRRTGNTSMTRVGAWVGATLVFFVVLGMLINEYSRPRAEGESMTGNGDGGSMAEIDAARQARLESAKEVLRNDPENLEALNILTYDALLYRDLDTAMEQMDRARALNPDDIGVKINLAILQMSVGMADRSAVALDEVLAVQPNNGRAMLWKGFVLANTGQQEEAIAALGAASALLEWPEERLFAEGMLRELTAPPPATHIAGSAVMVEGTEMPEGTLYIYARRSEAGGGPPVAAFRYDGGMPVDFALTDADMVMGGVWPDAVWVQARIDGDGDPMTKHDILAESAVIGPLSSGTEALSLLLAPSGVALPDVVMPDAVVPDEADPAEAAPVAGGARVSGSISGAHRAERVPAVLLRFRR